jgi:hypothetical protein
VSKLAPIGIATAHFAAVAVAAAAVAVVQAYDRAREAAHQRTLELHAQTQAHQATLTNQAAIVGMANGGYRYGVTENYCGPISWIIGLLLFPCICFCEYFSKTGPAAKTGVHLVPGHKACCTLVSAAGAAVLALLRCLWPDARTS